MKVLFFNVRLTLAATVSMAYCLIGGAVPGSSAETLGDDFSTNHSYWDGSTIDVTGTMWDGVQGTEFASSMDANTTNGGRLTISHGGTANSYVPGPLFDVAALYVEVPEDNAFDAKVQMPQMPNDVG